MFFNQSLIYKADYEPQSTGPKGTDSAVVFVAVVLRILAQRGMVAKM